MKFTKKILVCSLLLTLILGNFVFLPKIAQAEDKPDLVIAGIILSAPGVKVNQEVDITVTYKNQGSSSVTDNWNGYVNFGQFDGKFIFKDNSLPRTSGSYPSLDDPLEPSESFGETYTGYFIQAGTHNLSVNVDAENKINELNENNNSFTQTATVTVGSISASNVKTTPRSSTIMYLQWNSDYFNNTIVYYRMSDTTNEWQSTANCYNDLITGNRECSVVLYYLSPGDIYYYRFKEGNILQQESYSYFVMPIEISADQITLKNITNNSVSISWYTSEKLNSKVFYYPSPDSMFQETLTDSTFTNNHNVTLTNLDPNTKYKYQITSLNQEGGGLISSWDNKLTFTTTNIGQSDLTIKNVYFSPQEPKVGEPFNGQIKVEIANLGNASVTHSFPVHLVLSSSWVLLDWWGSSGQSTDVESINANTTKTLIFNFKNNFVFNDNPLEIRAWVDSNGVGLNENLQNDDLFIDESNENNNTFYKKITLSEDKPDLTIQDFKFTDLRKNSIGHWGKDWDIQLEFYITNIGTIKPQSDFKLKVINLSLNNKEIQTETYFRGYFEPNNYRAHVYVVGDIINQNNSFIFGENKIKISVDDGNLLNESDEDNNILVKTINITQEPTLTCTETDNGRDYYNGGTANGVAYWGKSLPASDISDTCTSGIKLNEMWCESDGYIHQESYDCPYGCANGACIPAVVKKPEVKNNYNPSETAKRLKGRLLLDVDQGGAIWYVDDINYQRHNVRWNTALNIFQMFALGISDEDLLKIPAKTESINSELDTDGDGYKDEHELKYNYNPYNSQPIKFKLDNNLGQRLKGRFLLQVQKQGAIWYVAENGYRYSVRWGNLQELFESLALGITNSDLNQIEAEK